MGHKLRLLFFVAAVVVAAFGEAGATSATEIHFNFAGMIPESSASCCEGSGRQHSFDLGGAQVVVAAWTSPFGIDPTSTDRPGFGFEVVAALCQLQNCVPKNVMVPLSEVLTLIDAATSDGNFNKFTADENIHVLAEQITVNAARDVFLDYSTPYAVTVQSLYVPRDSSFASLQQFVDDASNLVGAVSGSVFVATAVNLVGEERVQLFPDFATEEAALQAGEIQGIVAATVTTFTTDVVTLGGPLSTPNSLALVFPENSLLRNLFNVGLAELEADGTMSALRSKYRLE
ncbi:hypothetical protein QOT17_001782 [Balamuthia mandrillaris]